MSKIQSLVRLAAQTCASCFRYEHKGKITTLVLLVVLFALQTDFRYPLRYNETVIDKQQCSEQRYGHFAMRNFSTRSRQSADSIFVGLGTIEENDAVCQIPESCNLCHHFAHFAQFFFRCWSYWMQNQSKSPILVTKLVPKNNIGLLRNLGYIRSLVGSAQKGIGLKVFEDYPLKILPNAEFPDAFAMFNPSEDSELLRKLLVPKIQSIRCVAPRISILDRKKTRSLLNVEFIAAHFSELFDASITVKYFEKATFQEQMEFMANTDILISPHGAQLTSLIVMPECASVLELFPVSYYLPWFYGSLADASAVRHYSAYAGNRDPVADMVKIWANKTLRVAARSLGMCPSVSSLDAMLRQIVLNWYECCIKM